MLIVLFQIFQSQEKHRKECKESLPTKIDDFQQISTNQRRVLKNIVSIPQRKMLVTLKF